MEFCVQSKSVPGTYYLSKKLFAQVTANAQHHLVDNRNEKLSENNVVQNPSTEIPLESPSMNFNEHQMESAGGGRINKGGKRAQLQPAGKETALIQPAMNFSEETN